jgi:glycosyltransferase involved in cell wall biosynthesis
MTSPLRVLQIVNSVALGGPVGGAERLGVTLARAFDRTQVQPMLAALWNWEPTLEALWQRRLTEEGIPTFIGPRKDDRAPLRNFTDAVRTLARAVPGPVDIIHSQCDFGDVAAVLLQNCLGAKRIVRTAHNEREWPKRPLRRVLLVNGLYPLAFDAELGVSRRAVEVLDRRPLARLLGRRSIVAHNALDLGRFAGPRVTVEAARKRLGLPARCGPVIGSVGRLTRQKGYDVLLAAAPRVFDRLPDACFVIVGGGELAETLAAQARGLGIAERVYFTGVRDDIETILPGFDLFVSPSLWEGLPTVILEAMAAGAPVAATRVSGTVELVQAGVTGVLVAPGDPIQLAEAILTSVARPEAGQVMAARAREYVSAHFDIRAVAQQHEALYRRLLMVS